MNNHVLIAFDIDGTLINALTNAPRYDVIDLFLKYEKLGCIMFIWSGGGVDYAEHWRDKLGLNAKIVAKGSFIPHIAVDDLDVKLGQVNIKV